MSILSLMAFGQGLCLPFSFSCDIFMRWQNLNNIPCHLCFELKKKINFALGRQVDLLTTLIKQSTNTCTIKRLNTKGMILERLLAIITTLKTHKMLLYGTHDAWILSMGTKLKAISDLEIPRRSSAKSFCFIPCP